ncbi:hypothetical protein L5515_001541 [Caenorhabditis briggsae]|uniref:RecQ-mediated genome instability protein 1 n=1 Tax=Caenorhabditis briggsae TaxID=6238 RepID=A0AAE9J3K8_CAEBR|nr:hypothetical protein L5515_001541 [Caenorhabditis briggsae]
MEEKKLSDIFAKKHMQLKAAWLKTCIEFLKRTVNSEIQSSDAICDQVMLQFLYSNLSDSLVPVMKIPDHAAKVILVKKMVFQVVTYVNISVSLFEQLSECTRHNDDLSWFHGGAELHDDRNLEKDHTCDKNNNMRVIPKKRGMLKLEITDGQNKLEAVELEDVFDESLLVPGVKILLTGSVKCRRGILLLEKSNCDLLGGRVDSLKIDKVTQLSEALNIDLDSEKKRRKDSLEKVASAVSDSRKKQDSFDNRKNNNSLNQSTMSPFLVKTNRKTGEVTNPPPRAAVLINHPQSPEPAENRNFSIEEQPRSPTPEPPVRAYIDPIDVEYPQRNPPPMKRLSVLSIKEPIGFPVKKPDPPKKKDTKKLESNRTIDEWAFDYFNKTLSPKISNPRQLPRIEKKQEAPKKQLPGQLLRASSNSMQEQLNLCRPTLGSPSMPDDKRKEISKWVWDERKGSEEEDAPAIPKKDDSVVEIPRCFMREAQRHIDDPKVDRKPMFLRTLHGPRKGVDDFRKKESYLDKANITEHFPIIKGTISKPIPTKCPKPFEIVDETVPAFVEEEESDEEMNDIISVIPQPPIVFHQVEDDDVEKSGYSDVEDDVEDSIMECTIEKEGRMELEKWGLRGRKRMQEEEIRDGDYPINNRQEMRNYSNLMPPSPKVPSFHPLLTQTQELVGFQPSSSYHYLPNTTSQNSWNFATEPLQQITPPPNIRHPMIMKDDQRVKKEPEERLSIAVSQKNEEIKNKQSANVQIYKAPFAKRLASSDSSTINTNQLYQRMSDLQIVPLSDALVNRKFWMMSKIIVVMPTICHQVHELRSDGVDWLLQITVSDTSAASIKCRVATDLLNRLFGFNVQQCKNLFNSHQVEELRAKKAEAERKLVGFKRLDLLMWIEVSPEHEKLPLIVDVKTISDALNIL